MNCCPAKPPSDLLIEVPGAPDLAFETWESTTLNQPISSAQSLNKQQEFRSQPRRLCAILPACPSLPHPNCKPRNATLRSSA